MRKETSKKAEKKWKSRETHRNELGEEFPESERVQLREDASEVLDHVFLLLHGRRKRRRLRLSRSAHSAQYCHSDAHELQHEGIGNLLVIKEFCACAHLEFSLIEKAKPCPANLKNWHEQYELLFLKIIYSIWHSHRRKVIFDLIGKFLKSYQKN